MCGMVEFLVWFGCVKFPGDISADVTFSLSFLCLPFHVMAQPAVADVYGDGGGL